MKLKHPRVAIVGLLAMVLLVGAAVLVYGAGVIAVERHRGFFAPVWHPDGRQIYLFQRDTFGVVWGFGWEFFSPPADAYVISDRLSLLRLDPADGAAVVLDRFDGSPIEGRVTEHYRGRIFNTVSAAIEPGEDGVAFRVAMSVPKVPSSEQWSLRGRWTPSQPSGATWTREW